MINALDYPIHARKFSAMHHVAWVSTVPECVLTISYALGCHDAAVAYPCSRSAAQNLRLEVRQRCHQGGVMDEDLRCIGQH